MIGAIAGLVLALGTLLGVSPAYAGTGLGCYQDSCNGLDPTGSYNQRTGYECSSGAYDVWSGPALGGTLRLTWGPNCSTNWTRFTPGNSDQYEIWVTRLSDGVWAGTGLYHTYTFSNGSGVIHYSDQVYSPGAASACVKDDRTGQEYCYSQTS